MSSKLFKYLKNINTAREKMIDILNEDGLLLGEDSSFGYIADSLDAITKSRTPIKNDDVTYYDDPEDDPDVWKRPKIYKQIDEMWKNAKSYTHSEYNITMYPAAIYVIKTDLLDIKLLYLTSAGKTCTSSACANPYNSNELVLFYKPVSIGATYEYDIVYDLHFNDGQVYTHNGKVSSTIVSDLTHTFDTSKDLIDEDGVHYKYIMLYTNIHETEINVDSVTKSASHVERYPISFIGAGDNIELPYVILNPAFVNNKYGFYTTNQATKLYFLKYSNEPTRLERADYESLPTYHTFRYNRMMANTFGSSNNKYNGSWSRFLRRLEIDIPVYEDCSTNTVPVSLSITYLNTLISSRPIDAIDYNSLNTDIYLNQRVLPTTLTYLKGYKIHPSALAKKSATSYSSPSIYMSPSSIYTNRLKYLEYTCSDEEQEEYIKLTEDDWWEKNDQYNKRSYYYPLLPISKLYSFTKYVNHIYYFYAYDDGVIDTLVFPNLKTLYMSKNTNDKDFVNEYSLILPSVTGQYTPTSSTTPRYNIGLNFESVYLPNFDKPTARLSVYSSKNLYLNGLTDLNTQTLVLGREISNCYLPLLNLETANTSFLNNAVGNFILSNDYFISNSLDISSNSYLTKQGLVNIANVLATLEPSGSKTFKVPYVYGSHINSGDSIDQILNEIKEKGWTVTTAT